MARNNKGKKAAAPAPTSPKEDAAAGSEEAPGLAAEASCDSNVAESSVDAQGLKTELEAAKIEIEQLRELLSQKDKEIASLKAASSGSTERASSEDIEKLQERLAQLKRDQMEADAAREAAWRNLKSVVQEIAKLATPEAGKAATSSA